MGLTNALQRAWIAMPEGESDGAHSPGTPVPAPEVEEAAPATERAIYERHARAIHRFVRDMLGNESDAADATQETFFRAFGMLGELRDPDRLRPWLFGIARRVSLELFRARKRTRAARATEPCPEIDELTPEAMLLGREAQRIISAAMGRLREKRRAALLLRVDHELSYSDIAELMDWSVAKAKVEVHRGRLQLRTILAEHHAGGQR